MTSSKKTIASRIDAFSAKYFNQVWDGKTSAKKVKQVESGNDEFEGFALPSVITKNVSQLHGVELSEKTVVSLMTSNDVEYRPFNFKVDGVVKYVVMFDENAAISVISHKILEVRKLLKVINK